MYESPIDCFVTQFNIKRREFEEKQILKAIQGVGVNVDKHELEKALRYDREQYKKGYADGAKELAERYERYLLSQLTTAPLDKKEWRNFCLDELDNLKKEMAGSKPKTNCKSKNAKYRQKQAKACKCYKEAGAESG